MPRVACILVFLLGLVGNTIGVASAEPTSIAQSGVVAAAWGCHGHANTPHSANDQYGDPGIGYDGYMDCTGTFGSQKVCVKLQELDYYGSYYDRTAFSCNAGTVNPHAYIGRWVSCVQAGVGTYRTVFQGTAYPPGLPPQSRTATSAGAGFCSGYLAVQRK